MTATVLPLAESDLRKIVFAVNQLGQGRSNAVGSVTLTANTATTTVTATNCGAGSTPILTPTTANASAEFGGGSIYVGTVSNGSFVITHANNAQTDRTFLYAVLG
jgi:hypothetical protein